MNAVVVRRERRDLLERRRFLDTLRAQHAAAYDAALHRPGPYFDSNVVAREKADIDSLDRQLHALDDRQRVLEEALPSPAELAAIGDEVNRLLQDLGAEAIAFTPAARAYMVALERAEDAARQLAAARLRAQQLHGHLTTLIATGDLRIVVPAIPTLAQADVKRAVLITAILTECAEGCPSDVAENNLAALRQEVSA